ncbi:related to glutamyl-tRNA(Gln) amidotransferase subunit A [Cephalotrichum gorgonifer]|uniref:Glutamyl-tRNA(Gln) amidotransferase subunit A, mitochondrial n=1 Tax=Cephalotrichum gorgonifer TaxID=2041049 RepID=A0AAE8MVG9_9PEZI|nr:related to glutamyl-tRNA(Gln) amidotransferase subunit A [Cephalotrichum gorgonifer]
MNTVRHRACHASATLTRSLRIPSRWRTISTNHFIHREKDAVVPDSGFTFAVKDNIATAGHPTTCASAFLRDYESPFEATVVRQLRERGGVFVGKTNMDEFGMGSHSLNSAHGPVLNPKFDDVPRSAGGSSGGSAVAVRLGDADVALGTDTGGSIRLPAAYTGVVGYKPSYGMISRRGVVPYANSLDTVGFLARDVKPIYDLVIDGGLIHEHDELDPTSLTSQSRRRCSPGGDRRPPKLEEHFRNPSEITIGIPQDYRIAELHPSILAAWAAAEDALRKWGARVVPVRLPSTQVALPAYYVLAPAEASSNLAKYDGVRYGSRAEGGDTDASGEVLYSRTRGDNFGREVRRRILMGTYSLSSEAMDNYFVQAQRVRRLVQRDFDRVFARPNPLRDEEPFDLSDLEDGWELENKRGPAQVDFLLCPTAPTFPPRVEDVRTQGPVDSYMNDVFTVPASLAGLPAISVPVPAGNGMEEGGGVAGLQVLGQFWDDARVLGIAHQLSRLMPVV